MAKKNTVKKAAVKTVGKATKKVAPKPAANAAPVKKAALMKGAAVANPQTAAGKKEQPAPAAGALIRDPRLPAPGTVITRVRKGKEHKVKVLEHGFTYEGQTFRSLSAIANHIAGGSNNGFLFFKLIPKKAQA